MASGKDVASGFAMVPSREIHTDIGDWRLRWPNYPILPAAARLLHSRALRRSRTGATPWHSPTLLAAYYPDRRAGPSRPGPVNNTLVLPLRAADGPGTGRKRPAIGPPATRFAPNPTTCGGGEGTGEQTRRPATASRVRHLARSERGLVRGRRVRAGRRASD